MKLKVPTLKAQQAKIQTIDLGEVGIGPITVANLVLSNADFTMSAASGMLTGTSVSISIDITLEAHVHVGLPDGIPDIDLDATYQYPLVVGPIDLGNVTIPGLNNIQLHIPSLTAQQISVAPSSPVPIQLKNVTAETINATNFTMPSQGFSLAGMALTSVNGSGIGVPAANMDQATIQHLYGDPVKIPAFSLGGLIMAAAQIPDVSSSVPLNIDAILPTQNLYFGNPGDLLTMHLHITPSAHMHIGHLELTIDNASATVGNVVLQNVTLPYDVLNLKLSDIGIKTLQIPLFNVA